MRAEDVGWGTNRMVLGKHSGRNAFRSRCEELGIAFDTAEQLNEAFQRFKELADKKHEIFDEDLQALATEAVAALEEEQSVSLVAFRCCSETGETPVADVTLKVDGEEKKSSAAGDGPVDAAFKAIDSLLEVRAELLLYSVNNITTGTDAQGEVTVRLERGGRVVNGQGSDTDIVIASAKAYLNALNRLRTSAGRTHPQAEGV